MWQECLCWCGEGVARVSVGVGEGGCEGVAGVW